MPTVAMPSPRDLALPLTALRHSLSRDAAVPQTRAASLLILTAAVLTALLAVAEIARSVGADAAHERPVGTANRSNSLPS